MPSRKMFQIAGALSAVVLIFFGLYHPWLQGYAKSAQKTLGMKYIAGEIRARVGENFPITYAGAPPYAVQFYLNTLRRNAKFKPAAAVLRSDAPAFALVEDYDRLLEEVGTNTVLHELIRWTGKDESTVRLVGNRPKLEPTDSVEACLGPTRLRLDHARLERARDNEFTITPLGKDTVVTLQNVSTNAVTVAVRWSAQPHELFSRKLAAAESWRVTAP